MIKKYKRFIEGLDESPYSNWSEETHQQLIDNIEGILVGLDDLEYSYRISNTIMELGINIRPVKHFLSTPIRDMATSDRKYIDIELIRDYIETVIDYMIDYNGGETGISYYYEVLINSYGRTAKTSSDKLEDQRRPIVSLQIYISKK